MSTARCHSANRDRTAGRTPATQSGRAGPRADRAASCPRFARACCSGYANAGKLQYKLNLTLTYGQARVTLLPYTCSCHQPLVEWYEQGHIERLPTFACIPELLGSTLEMGPCTVLTREATQVSLVSWMGSIFTTTSVTGINVIINGASFIS